MCCFLYKAHRHNHKHETTMRQTFSFSISIYSISNSFFDVLPEEKTPVISCVSPLEFQMYGSPFQPHEEKYALRNHGYKIKSMT